VHDHSAINSWFVLARAIHFGASLLLLGTFFFDRFVAVAAPSVESQWKSVAGRLVLLSLALSLLTGAWWLGIVTMEMSGLPSAEAFQLQVLATVWNQTRFGQVWKIRLICWLLCALAAAPFIRSSAPRSRLTWACLGLGTSALFVAGLAWAGHGQYGSAHLVADVLHLLVSAVWPVGLLPLGMILVGAWPAGGRGSCRAGPFVLQAFPPAPSALPENHLLGGSLALPELSHQQSLAQLVRRFSFLSILSVLLLTATGIINSWGLAGPISNLLTTPYGRVLLLKIALFVVMLAIGAINLLYLKPRITVQTRAAHIRKLQLNVGAEILLAAAVLGVVGLLGLLEPGM
jgi:putative copper resistance protein D